MPYIMTDRVLNTII